MFFLFVCTAIAAAVPPKAVQVEAELELVSIVQVGEAGRHPEATQWCLFNGASVLCSSGRGSQPVELGQCDHKSLTAPLCKPCTFRGH